MKSVRRALPVALFFVALLALLVLGSSFLSRRSSAEELSITRESVQRAAIQCYALEGFYPQQLTYLTDHYGLAIDQGKYFVDYQFMGSNLMPDITVLPLA